MTALTARRRAMSVDAPFGAWVDVTGVFGIAFAVRMVYLLTSPGGLGGNFGYDAGVYYTAAASLLHGAVPYSGFTMLHPPGLMLALVPFAAFGRATNDHLGFETATVAFIALASVNATLVRAIGRRCGLSRVTSSLGGLFYAVWFGAIGAEVSARLEPLGSLAFLGGVLLLVPAERAGSRRAVCGGALLAVAAAVKIWWILPAVVILVWLARQRSCRHAAFHGGAGLLIGLSVVIGPFFLAAPGEFWRMVVRDQVGRPRVRPSGLDRVNALSSFHAAHVLSGIPPVVPFAAAAALALALSWRVWPVPVGRLVAVVFWMQLGVLAAAPTYFSYYSGYLAPAAALLVAFAGGNCRPRRIDAARGAVLTATALTGCALVLGSGTVSAPFPGTQLSSDVRGVHCLMTDSPMALIELDTLTSNLDNGCPNWVDVSGRTYDVDAPPNRRHVARRDNPRWQADILRYLRSGDAAVVIRAGTGLDAATRRTISSWPVLKKVDGVTIYRTVH